MICKDAPPLPLPPLWRPQQSAIFYFWAKKSNESNGERTNGDTGWFRFGLRSKTPAAASSLVATPASDQLDCVRSVMVPGVVFNTGRGENYVIQSWRRFSLWFDDIVVDLNELQKLDSKSVLAITRTSVTITEQTLRCVFPHLCDEASPRLAPKLLNQRVVVEGWTRFDWDSASHRVTSITSEADLLTPIQSLLGSLEEACFVFEKSLRFSGNAVIVDRCIECIIHVRRVRIQLSIIPGSRSYIKRQAANDRWTLDKIVRAGYAFHKFLYARYAKDVTFEQAIKPSGNVNEITRYYSGKHHLYGYKVEVVVLPNGLAINCTDHAGGSTHDAKIFRDNAAFHLQALPDRSLLVLLPFYYPTNLLDQIAKDIAFDLREEAIAPADIDEEDNSEGEEAVVNDTEEGAANVEGVGLEHADREDDGCDLNDAGNVGPNRHDQESATRHDSEPSMGVAVEDDAVDDERDTMSNELPQQVPNELEQQRQSNAEDNSTINGS
ncbi:unnamed protein product [Phytophthora fragariaefolia]|uniref:Unnamed protein product n=1 Tax=Phytophthora fragariaefolia TaxID=1490495 RepID=A0A9W7D7C4_9STRA|nr:unnamed protein product [Phytophthora fragariaefolia]